MKPYKIITANKNTVVVDYFNKTITYDVVLENDKFVDLTTTEDDSDVSLSIISMVCREVETMI